MFYQITAVYQGAEIGYGEGERLAYAKQECLDSIDSIYQCVFSEIKYIIVHSVLA